MTHDELIKYIDDSTDGLKHEHLFEKLLANTKALRAIVELHTPIYDNSCSDADCCGGPYPNLCDGCKDDYPCATIQAIEKELK